jgi:hypothetical protein
LNPPEKKKKRKGKEKAKKGKKGAEKGRDGHTPTGTDYRPWAQTLKTLLSQGSINIAIIPPALFKQRPLHHKGSEG